MNYYLLGNSGLRVSELCLGTNTFGTEWGIGTDQQGAQAIFDAFAESGGTFIDTANNYNRGTSELFLGDFLKGKREQFVVATKWSMATHNHPNGGGNGRKALFAAVEASLKRLQTEYIDLLYLHAWDGLTPAEEVMRALDDLVHQGKVHYLGLSDTPAWVAGRMDLMAELRGWSRIVALQLEYSLAERSPERELLPMANQLKMGTIAWYALAAGVLTGKYNKADNADGRLKEESRYRNTTNLAIAAQVIEIARELGKTPAQVAINWVRQQGVIPLIGSSKAEQTKENIACLSFTLEKEHLTLLDKISAIDPGFPANFYSREGMDKTLKKFPKLYPGADV